MKLRYMGPIYIFTVLFSNYLHGGGCCSTCCDKGNTNNNVNNITKQKTAQIAALARTDTRRLQHILNSSSSKARRLKKRATLELEKPARKDSYEVIEEQNRVAARRLAEEKKREALEEKERKEKKEAMPLEDVS